MKHRRFVVPVLALLLALVLSDRGAAQTATGAYVQVATWEETATTVPAGVWNDPTGIDLTAAGEIFVADRRLRRVEVLDTAGTPLREFGRGPSKDDLAQPTHLAVDAARDRVYVTDAGARRVAVYSLGGAAIDLWTNVGTPQGVAVAPDGRVVVTDIASDTVRVLAPDGTETASWGGTGAGPDQLDFPAGVHVSADGTVWVADRGNGRIVGSGLDGTPRESIKLTAPQVSGSEPLDVSTDGDDLWVATQVGLVRYSIDGGGRSVRSLLDEAPATAVSVLPQFGLYATVSPLDGYPGVWRYHHGQGSGAPTDSWGGPITVPGFFDNLEALAVGDDDRAYLLDVPARVQRLAPTGLVDQQYLIEDPEEVDADSAGNIYTVGTDKVHATAADGSPLWEARIRASSPGADVAFAGVGWDETNQAVVAMDAGGRRLHFVGAAGDDLGSWTLKSTQAGRQSWTDLAVGADGVRYALDSGNGQVRGWDVYERLLLELDLSMPASRMDIAPDGTVLILEPGGWAHQLARDGSLLASWDTVRLELGRGSRPVDIAVDSSGRVYVADGAADVVTVYEWDPNAPKPEPPEVESGCEIRADKVASPPEIPLGAEVDVSLVVRGECAGTQSAADIGLLIDVSMDRSSFKAARRAAENFVDLVEPSSDLVAIQPGGDSSGRLTNDLQFLRRVARRLDPAEEFNLGGGITAAEGELFGVRGRHGVKKVLIILFGSSRGEDVEYWQWWQIQRTAGQLKRRGAEIYTIAMGRGTDMQLLYDIASSRSHVYQSRGTWDLDSVYMRVVAEIKPSSVLEELTITDEIPDNMEYVDGSSVPPAALQGRTLVWRLGEVPLAGTGVRYSLRPMEAGEWPTNVVAYGAFVDGMGESGRVEFPVPMVRVLAPTPTPTATPVPTHTPLPTATLVPTAEPSPTPSVRAVYLPLALRERCDPKSRHVDVALVLDASTSMDLPTAAGRSKLEAATEATGLFLDALDFEHDQAAIVTFNETAEVRQVLTHDREALVVALGAIPTAPQTRIDLGVVAAHAELVSERHLAGNQRAMIVLSDGYANPEPPETAVEAARVAKEAGVVIFTIGIGDAIDVEALEQMASQPEYFYRAPDAEDLAEIYAAIAVQIPCAPGSFWGG